MASSIAVIGTGYVGLVTGACVADMGHEVIGVDRDYGKVAKLQKAEMPIFEPGLREIVVSGMQGGRLSFTHSMERAIVSADIIMIAVGTPARDNGDVDMSQFEEAIEAIAKYAVGPKIVVVKSTVPVGTCKLTEDHLRKTACSQASFDVISNPEFLREGSAIHDTFHPDRIVIGSANELASARVAKLYASIDAPVLHTDRESAELIKYASNAFLAAKISFINEMAHVCEGVGADVTLIAKGMGLDRRIGPHFLQAGIGYGGSCFPKDTRAQLKIVQNVDYDFKILRSVIEVNGLQRQRFVQKIKDALGGDVNRKRIAVLGLAFKPNTDDVRDAPAIDVIEALQREGAIIAAYDPAAVLNASRKLKGVRMSTNPYEVLGDADAMVIATEWEEVKKLDLNRVKKLLRQPIVIDGRNVFDAAAMSKQGFHYVSIGRPSFAAAAELETANLF